MIEHLPIVPATEGKCSWSHGNPNITGESVPFALMMCFTNIGIITDIRYVDVSAK